MPKASYNQDMKNTNKAVHHGWAVEAETTTEALVLLWASIDEAAKRGIVTTNERIQNGKNESKESDKIHWPQNQKIKETKAAAKEVTSEELAHAIANTIRQDCDRDGPIRRTIEEVRAETAATRIPHSR